MTRHQTTRKPGQRSNARIFAIPTLIGIAAITGLILGLTGDGWRDTAAWLLVGLAPFVILAALLRRTPANTKS